MNLLLFGTTLLVLVGSCAVEAHIHLSEGVWRPEYAGRHTVRVAHRNQL